MAKRERKIPAFSPDELEMVDKIQSDVLNKGPGEPAPVTSAGEPPVKPKIWSMFAKGGKVLNRKTWGK